MPTTDPQSKSQKSTCAQCGKDFLVTEHEQKFYAKKQLPHPLNCLDCRRVRRASLRNPRTLFNRPCDKCGTSLQSTYPPNSPYKIFCEPCYHDSL